MTTEWIITNTMDNYESPLERVFGCKILSNIICLYLTNNSNSAECRVLTEDGNTVGDMNVGSGLGSGCADNSANGDDNRADCMLTTSVGSVSYATRSYTMGSNWNPLIYISKYFDT